MKISLLKEIKPQEFRVGLTPDNVEELVVAGHTVMVEYAAGDGSGFADEEYLQAGAKLVDAQTAWDNAEMVVKVKEPIEAEYKYFREGLVIYTYFHLASNKPLTEALLKHKVIAMAYETVELADGKLPLLTPMSEIAGRMSVQIGAHFLEKHEGGRGVLLSGIPGVKPGKVVVLGGGVVGMNAAKMAVGMGAEVVVLDRTVERLRYLESIFGNTIDTLVSSPTTIAQEVQDADLVVGAVLVTGAAAPKLITKEMVSTMLEGSVIVDVAIDQGGCVETMDHYTTHENPTYLVDGVVHYAVANMPGAVARTATLGLTNATYKYAKIIADLGFQQAMKQYPELQAGLNTDNGKITCRGVQEAFPDLG